MAKKKSKKKTEEPQRTKSERAPTFLGLEESVLRQAEREAGQAKYLTPFTLSQRLGISVSYAKNILRELEKRGRVKLYSPGKRDPIYVPAK